MRRLRWCQWPWSFKVAPASFPADLSQPAGDALPAWADSRIADSTILGERTLSAHGAHTNARFVVLEYQLVAGADAKNPPHLQRDRDLPLAGNGGLLLHDKPRFLTLTYDPYPGRLRSVRLKVVGILLTPPAVRKNYRSPSFSSLKPMS